ncbi:MAG: rhodanese-like domain-containing protein [Bacteroidales bacterium]
MRKKITTLLLPLSLILALLPLSANRSFTGKPDNLLSDVLVPDVTLSVDQVARLIVLEDSTFQLIDLRSSEDFRKLCIPGSANVPYPDFIKNDPEIYLGNKNIKTIFYSNGDFDSNYAMVYARGLGYASYVMAGGLSEWLSTIMETRFTGGRISARENALFEIRSKAGKLFSELNTLPDSLKVKFMESKKFSAKKLDGGCE